MPFREGCGSCAFRRLTPGGRTLKSAEPAPFTSPPGKVLAPLSMAQTALAARSGRKCLRAHHTGIGFDARDDITNPVAQHGRPPFLRRPDRLQTHGMRSDTHGHGLYVFGGISDHFKTAVNRVGRGKTRQINPPSPP